jgi:hypothetical protein
MISLRKMLMTVAASFAVTCIHAEDLSCRIDERVVQEFAESVFPIKVAGKKKVEMTILGSKVAKEIPWTATVSRPKIAIDNENQSFVADVSVKAEGGITWDGKVDGILDIAYNEKQRALVVQVSEAIVPVSVGPLAFKLDVSEEVPEMPFHFSLPDFHASFNGKKVHVSTDPSVRFEHDAIILEGKVECRVDD